MHISESVSRPRKLAGLAVLACLLLASYIATRPALAGEIVDAIRDAVLLLGGLFELANTSTPLLGLILPAAVCTAVILLLMLFDPQARHPSRTIAILLLTTLYTVYMAYRTFATLNLATPGVATLSIVVLIAEFLAYLKALSAYLQLLWPTNRSPQADVLAVEVTSGRYLPSVDVFIPTYSEPVEILRRTILGCQSLRYPHKQIYLLDDQRRPAVRALARELGCQYRERPDNRDAKAGNMNAALGSTRGELIAVFDADFIPTEDFLERTVGFFTDPGLGLVQTPQNFYSPDAVSRNLGLPRIVTEEQQVFFRAAQPGRDHFGAALCHGTSFVIRRSALEEIGKFPGETLSEDWATSVKLQASGYRTAYLNELLSAGAAAEFTSEFVTQRLRWARGTLQCFFASTNPITIPGLTFMQRIIHLCGPLHYLPYLSRLLFLLLPLIYFWFGTMPFIASLELLAIFFLPYWLCQTLSLSWLTRGHRSAFWSEVYDTMLCVPISATVASTLIYPFGKPFKVSAKGTTRSGLTFTPTVGVPLLVLLALYIPTVIFALATGRWSGDPTAMWLALACSGYIIFLLWLSLLASLDVPQSSVHPAFSHDLDASLRSRGDRIALRIEQISEDAFVASGIGRDSGPGDSRDCMLTVAIAGIHELPVIVSETSEGKLVLKPRDISVEQHRRLVRFLYCRPDQWDSRGVPEPVTFWHFLHAPFRVYGLAETT